MTQHSEKFYHIELMRFVFSVVIVYFHILHSNIFPCAGSALEQYNILARRCDYAGIIVECFFILSGFFFYFSFWKNSEQTFGDFVQKKIARLWPVLAFSIFISVVFFYDAIEPQFFNLLFLQCIGLSLEYKGINWYISPFFWAILFYFGLLKCIRQKNQQNLIMAVIVYFSYAINLQSTHGGFVRETVGIGLNLGLLRALAGIGMGYLLAQIHESLQAKFQPIYQNKHKNLIFKILISLLEIFLSMCLIIHFLWKRFSYNWQFIVVIEFSILLLCLVSKKGLISFLFNHKIFDIGKYAYCIYVMQQISFNILKITLWKTSLVQQNLALTITLSLVFSVFTGIITFYLVEKPLNKMASRF